MKCTSLSGSRHAVNHGIFRGGNRRFSFETSCWRRFQVTGFLTAKNAKPVQSRGAQRAQKIRRVSSLRPLRKVSPTSLRPLRLNQTGEHKMSILKLYSSRRKTGVGFPASMVVAHLSATCPQNHAKLRSSARPCGQVAGSGGAVSEFRRMVSNISGMVIALDWRQCGFSLHFGRMLLR